jgi:hypothetical protein
MEFGYNKNMSDHQPENSTKVKHKKDTKIKTESDLLKIVPIIYHFQN